MSPESLLQCGGDPYSQVVFAGLLDPFRRVDLRTTRLLTKHDWLVEGSVVSDLTHGLEEGHCVFDKVLADSQGVVFTFIIRNSDVSEEHFLRLFNCLTSQRELSHEISLRHHSEEGEFCGSPLILLRVTAILRNTLV